MVFGLSSLGMSGRWNIEQKIAGATSPPTSDHAVRLTIEASQEPAVGAKNRLGDPIAACNLFGLSNTPANKTTCLLSPGARLDGSAEIRGQCPHSFCRACKPPAGAFLRASAEVVRVWRRTVTMDAQVKVPRGGPGTGQQVALIIVPDVPELSVVVRGKGVADRIPGWDGSAREATCGRWVHDTLPEGQTRCSVLSRLVPEGPQPLEISVAIEATIFGACPDASDAAALCNPSTNVVMPQILSVGGDLTR